MRRIRGFVLVLWALPAAAADFQFADVSAAVGILSYEMHAGPGGAVLAVDYDDDGDVDLFAVRLVTSGEAFGDEVRVLVQVYHPYGSRPLRGAEVEVAFNFENGGTVERRKRSDANGEARFHAAIPDDSAAYWVSVGASVTWRGETREVDGWIYTERRPAAFLGTDRRLYRPGETLHVRGLWLDRRRRPLAGRDVEIEILDPRARTVVLETLRTSAYGVASFDWQIPETAVAGEYGIAYEPVDGGAWTEVRVAPYELPSLRVTAEPTAPYHLPGEDAELAVETTTLDGEPLAGVVVDLAADEEDDPSGRVASRGAVTTGVAGRAVLRLDVSGAQARLARYSWRTEDRLVDVVASDPRSGRSERVPVVLRLARTPIQVYLTGTLPAPGRSGRAWVTTTYADGTPAATVVEIRQGTGRGRLLGRLGTNRFGVARLDDRAAPALPPGAASGDAGYVVVARDAASRRGAAGAREGFEEAPRLVATAPRTLHRRGEPLEVALHSGEPLERVEVEVVRRGERLAARTIPRLDGTETLRFRYRPSFVGAVRVQARATAIDPADPEAVAAAAWTALYPRAGGGLGLAVASDRERYRPGELTRLDVRVDGVSSPAALGVAVVDAAVEARAESDGLGGGSPLLGSVEDALADEGLRVEGLAGWNVAQLLDALESPAELPRGLDLLAEVLLQNAGFAFLADVSSPVGEETEEHRELFELQFESLEEAFYRALVKAAGALPDDPQALDAFLREGTAGFDLGRLFDPWGSPYCARFSRRGSDHVLELVSAGRDRREETFDDFTAWTVRVPWGWYHRRQLAEALARLDLPPAAGVEDLREALEPETASWRDPWGEPLDLTIARARIAGRTVPQVATIALRSAGPDRRPETGDDVLVRVFHSLAAERGPAPAAAPRGKGVIVGTVTDDSGAFLPGVAVIAEERPGGRRAVVVTGVQGDFELFVAPGVYRVTVALEGFGTVEYPAVVVGDQEMVDLVAVLAVTTVEETVLVTAESPAAAQPTGPRPPSARKRLATPRLRREFPQTLLWLPEERTDAAGRATIPLELADNVTTWKVAAVASTLDGRLAVARHDVVATQPFYVEPDLPRRLTAGDEIALPVYLYNRSGSAQEVAVEVGEARREVSLAAGAVERLDVVQGFPSPGEEKVRVTAASAELADAVERSVEVGFDGLERARTRNLLLRGSSEIELVVPEDALAGSGRLELAVYHDLDDHLLTALESLARRPTGCAEQTTSTAWVSLLLLRVLAARGEDAAPEAERARRYVRLAHDTLAGYQGDGGGFGYWTGTRPDPALTAYVLDFLNESRRLVPVDESMIEDAAAWLGSLPASGGWRRGSSSVTEPYALAVDVLAAASGDAEGAAAGRRRLAELARDDEEGGFYWEQEGRTPFYGWGAAGRLETTALAVRALNTGDGFEREITGGITYLFLHKESDGLWASTQATLQVLRVLADAFASSGKRASRLAVALDGEDLELPRERPGTVAAPLVVPLGPGPHHLRVEGTSEGWGLVQATVRHHVAWDAAAELPRAESLRYGVDCGPRELTVGETVTCTVTVGRALSGGGMLIAEIGLPPGAEVDRASLEEARKTGRGLTRYEVWPDRVVAYLWPRPGRTSFELRWRPRMGIRARSAPSVLYDYYNPEARTVVAPDDYRVGGREP